jgi:hypothetical protein
LVRHLFFLAGFVANGKMNVAGGLDDPVTPSLGPSTGTHHGCAPIHMYRRYLQFVYVRPIIMFCVRNGWFKQFANNDRCFFGTECEQIQRSINRQPADLIGYQAAFLLR